MKTVLVTGAGGYIGGVLVPKLLDKGYKVKALDRFFFGDDILKDHENLTLIRDDARRMKVEYLADVQAVIDLVAISNDPSGELFSETTWQTNHVSRVRTANLAKQVGVENYILPSSCSIYGFQDDKVTETAPTNPLTVYAKANERAENGVLGLGDDKFTVTVMRQATVFGYGPRMRFDLAINGMTYGAWKTGKLPLMRDGSQYRPMLHVQDTTDLMVKFLETEPEKINNQIFNVGSDENNYRIGDLGSIVAESVGEKIGKRVEIEWYGDPDHRSYKVDFTKVETTVGWKAKYNAQMGVAEIVEKLQAGSLEKTDRTITLEWYKQLAAWHETVKKMELYGGMLNLPQ